ncbi:unnamed protein product [Prorocentrum cordatum]|uniref:C2 domain-containing protein n=1 Tax=Prorocentrum cordatum TaxID=2364126 RepID=A0ABN9Y008_9DINO|nr:unnamed protein product [Polarella glacialis]
MKPQRPASGGAGDSILDQVANRPKFCERRELAFARPERARDKLLSYSTLKVKVVKARSLVEADIVSSDPYAEVYVDDVLKGHTPTVFKSLNPVWNWEKTLEIKHPASVVLVRVMDYDLSNPDDMLGFVEFPVADLPLETCTAGWFRLHPAEKLVGKASQRLEKISEPLEETCGAVFLELTRKIESGDATDEQYAWCLPDPEPIDWPEYTGARKKLDAQALIDSIMDFKTALLGGLIRPLMTGVGYILGWRNIPMTSCVLAICLGVSYRPELFISGMLLMAGLLLLMTSDPSVCSAMSLLPAAVPLDDAGYALIAQTKDTDAAVAFLQRVVFALQGTVADDDKLREFAAFSSHEGEAVAESYADLKRQLHKAKANKESRCPIIKTDDKPLKKGALVHRSGQKGEVVSCKNPDEVLTWEYEVQFDGADAPEVVRADRLDSRTDMRWMSGDAMLAIIPDSVEDSLIGWTAFFRSLTTTLEGAEKPIRDIAGWKDKTKTLTVAVACLVLSVLFLWIQRLFCFAVAVYLFAKNTEAWISFFAKRRGQAALEKQKGARDVSEWGFFTRASADDDKAGSKAPLLQSFMDSARSTFGMGKA